MPTSLLLSLYRQCGRGESSTPYYPQVRGQEEEDGRLEEVVVLAASPVGTPPESLQGCQSLILEEEEQEGRGEVAWE